MSSVSTATVITSVANCCENSIKFSRQLVIKDINVSLIIFQHAASDSKKVALKTLSLKSTGLYRCEISAEAPSFASIQGEGRLEVVCKYIMLFYNNRNLLLRKP